MKYLPYILKHLRKTWVRTLSTIAAMGLCIFLISVLQTALEAFYGGIETASTERLITRHRISLAEDIPVAYEPRIAAVPGVRRVAKVTWFGGTPCRPRAFLVRDSTMMMRVKLVVITMSAGATDSSVSRMMTRIPWAGFSCVPPRSMSMDA